MKTRLFYLDFLKGFAILLVILGHVIQYNINDPYNNIVFRYIYAFHMPLFMFISGFVSYKEKSKLKYIKKRACQLLVPFFVWPIASNLLFSGSFDFSFYRSMYIDPGSGALWFLYVLFLISSFVTLVTWLMQKNIYNQSSLLLFFSFLSIGVLIFFHSVFNFRLVAGLHSYCMFLPFYVIGYLSKKNEIVFWKFVDRYLILYFISFAVLAYFFVLNSCPSFVHSKSMLISFSYNSVVGLLGIFTCFSWCHRFISQDVSNVLAQVFTKLGGKTLGLYSVHLYIGLWAAHLIVPSVSNIIFYLSLLFLSCTIMSYIAVICLEKGKIVSILFLGNTKLLFNS